MLGWTCLIISVRFVVWASYISNFSVISGFLRLLMTCNMCKLMVMFVYVFVSKWVVCLHPPFTQHPNLVTAQVA